jgi:hypothetical protein
VPADLAPWLSNEVAGLEDPDQIGGAVLYDLRTLIDRAGRLDTRWLVTTLQTRLGDDEETEGEGAGPRWRGLPREVRLSGFVRPVSSEDADRVELRDDVEALLDIAARPGLASYNAPKYLSDIDPAGHVVPSRAAWRIDDAASAREASQYARIASAYPRSSPAWKAMAEAACRAARRFTARERASLFRALTPSVKSWSAPLGEVADVFKAAVSEAEGRLSDSAGTSLREYWKWEFERAQAELAAQKESVKEDFER